MSFGQPLYLSGLILLPLLVIFLIWAERRRQHALHSLGDSALVEKLTDTVNQRGRRWRQRFWLIGIALVLVAIARPQWGTSTQVVAQEGIQIMVALDISESMLAQDLQPDRLTRAKQTIIELMDQLRGDQVGVALFSGAAFIQFPITSDYGTARAFLLSAEPSMISRGGSNLGDAIRTASSGFDTQRSSQKVIIIMTDGESHDRSPLAEARQAAEEGIVIYAIGFGSAEGGPIPQFNQIGQLVGYKTDRSGQIVNTRIEESVLREIASITNGEYFRASASGDEIGILADLIAQLESAELESRFEVQAVERFYLFLILALLCFVAAEIIPERQRVSPRFEQLLGVLLVGWVLTGCSGAAEGIQQLAEGNDQFAAEAYEESLNSYTAARAAGVESAEPLYNSANAQYRQARLPESAETMQQALDIADEQLGADAQFNLGNVHYRQAEWEDAIEAYKQALRLDPADIDAKYNLELAMQQLEQEQQPTPTPEPEEEQEQEEDSGGAEEETPEAEQPEEGEEDPTSEQPTPTPEPSSDGGDDESEAPPEEPTPDPTAEPEQPPDDPNEDNESEPPPDGSNNPPPPPPPSGELTEDQALQLLDAIEQDTETLQEQLNQSYTEPGPPPDKDW